MEYYYKDIKGLSILSHKLYMQKFVCMLFYLLLFHAEGIWMEVGMIMKIAHILDSFFLYLLFIRKK